MTDLDRLAKAMEAMAMELHELNRTVTKIEALLKKRLRAYNLDDSAFIPGPLEREGEPYGA